MNMHDALRRTRVQGGFLRFLRKCLLFRNASVVCNENFTIYGQYDIVYEYYKIIFEYYSSFEKYASESQ